MELINAMKTLDDFGKLSAKIAQTDLSAVLFPDELREWNATPPETKERWLAALCAAPITHGLGLAPLLYSRMKWLDVFKTFGANGDFSLMEVGAGSGTTLPEAMALYAGNFANGSPRYVTLNMNKDLSREFRKNAAKLPITVTVIEDDAINVKNHIPPGSVDIVAFEHSVNDILQAILAEKNGIDTSARDWWEILPEMIRMISLAYKNRTLEYETKTPFLRLVQNCADILRPGGILAMTHYVLRYDMDLGHDTELWENMIPVVRPWLGGLTGGKEILYDGFDPQWRFFWEKR